jgi:hypothetical protein
MDGERATGPSFTIPTAPIPSFRPSGANATRRAGTQRKTPIAEAAATHHGPYRGSSSVLSMPVKPVMASDVSTSPRIISSTERI